MDNSNIEIQWHIHRENNWGEGFKKTRRKKKKENQKTHLALGTEKSRRSTFVRPLSLDGIPGSYVWSAVLLSNTVTETEDAGNHCSWRKQMQASLSGMGGPTKSLLEDFPWVCGSLFLKVSREILEWWTIRWEAASPRQVASSEVTIASWRSTCCEARGPDDDLLWSESLCWPCHCSENQMGMFLVR